MIIDKMKNFSYRMMVFAFKLSDFFNPVGSILEEFNINQGDVVVDYGCGPGRYIKKAVDLVGSTGKVYAVDMNKIAIKYVKKEINKSNLQNVYPVLSQRDNSTLDNDVADIIYALDMFHDISEPEIFFEELARIIKKDGVLYIEDGHQSRKQAIKKIERSKLWKINNEKSKYLICKPIK
jgi:ubiquinone/menaquinone biosynthesis C-methylase UbiE